MDTVVNDASMNGYRETRKSREYAPNASLRIGINHVKNEIKDVINKPFGSDVGLSL
jgi:hypothetical protein